MTLAAERQDARQTDAVVAGLIHYLETGDVPDELFAADVISDVSLVCWRLRGVTAAEAIAVRTSGHPFPGHVRVERLDRTERGFVLQFEERWVHEGQEWYCREMIRADVQGGHLVDMAVYCTGDWDQARQRAHADATSLPRP